MWFLLHRNQGIKSISKIDAVLLRFFSLASSHDTSTSHTCLNLQQQQLKLGGRSLSLSISSDWAISPWYHRWGRCLFRSKCWAQRPHIPRTGRWWQQATGCSKCCQTPRRDAFNIQMTNKTHVMYHGAAAVSIYYLLHSLFWDIHFEILMTLLSDFKVGPDLKTDWPLVTEARYSKYSIKPSLLLIMKARH